ncbi:hypothetical protein [Streptomyces sp. NPDC057909]|uniref:hypothetical protein n=1 Tax=Streptomyces sp. NPDC057909 TaxID=3346277 RepID=UPI0036F10828
MPLRVSERLLQSIVAILGSGVIGCGKWTLAELVDGLGHDGADRRHLKLPRPASGCGEPFGDDAGQFIGPAVDVTQGPL